MASSLFQCILACLTAFINTIDPSILLSVDPSPPTNSLLLFDDDLSYNWFCNV